MKLKSLSKDGFYGWINVIVASVFMFTLTIVMQTFSFFLPEWIDEFGWKYKDVSFSMTINMIVMAFITPLVGLFVEKYGARLAIVMGSAISIAGVYVLANVHELWHLYIGHGVIVTAGATLGGMLAVTTLINNWFLKKRSLTLSIPMAAMGIAGIIIAPTIPWLIIHIGWRFTYMTIIPIYFVFALLIPGIFLRNTPEELGQVTDGPAARGLWSNQQEITKEELIAKSFITPVDFTAAEAFKTRAMWMFLIFNAFNMIAMGAIMAHGFAFLGDIGVPSVKAGLVMGITSGAMVAGQLLVGFLGLKFDMHRLAMLGCAGIIISYVLMVFASYSLIIVYVYAIFGGMGIGINLVAIMNLIPNYFGVKHFPKIVGLTLPVGMLIGSSGAPVCGFIRDVTGSYILFWKITALLMTAGLLCLFFARPPKHPSISNKK